MQNTYTTSCLKHAGHIFFSGLQYICAAGPGSSGAEGGLAVAKGAGHAEGPAYQGSVGVCASQGGGGGRGREPACAESMTGVSYRRRRCKRAGIALLSTESFYVEASHSDQNRRVLSTGLGSRFGLLDK